MSFAVALAQGYQNDVLELEETEIPLRCVYYSYCVNIMIERDAFILLVNGCGYLWPHPPLLTNIFRPNLLLLHPNAHHLRYAVKELEDKDPLQVEKWSNHVDSIVLPRLTLEVSEQFTIILTTISHYCLHLWILDHVSINNCSRPPLLDVILRKEVTQLKSNCISWKNLTVIPMA